jgi:uncharacterized protein YqgV (UPF0045/DUF77 family)
MLVELTIIRSGTGAHLSDQLADIVGIVDSSGLPYELTPAGTIEGEMGRGDGSRPPLSRSGPERRRTHQTLISIEDEKDEKNKLRRNIEALEKRLGHTLRRAH